MGFFEHYFKFSSAETEVAVCCPFPHHTANGVEYFETNPSASVNTKLRMFHCMACNQGFSELTMISKLLDCTYANAVRLNKAFENRDTVEDWDKMTYLSEPGRALCDKFGITEEVIKELHIAGMSINSITFPVFMYGKLIDERTYTPNEHPKVKSKMGAPSGVVIPYDILESSPLTNMVYICAGEKDMATSRSHGLNAYTITGGENALPISPTVFKGRHVCILYDNDEAGRLGASRLASYLLPYCASVRVCTEFHKICTEDKEDMTDYWNKYHGTKEALIEMVKRTPLFTENDVQQTFVEVPQVTLAQATSPEYLNKLVKSNIQVTAVAEVQYLTPKAAVAEKLKTDDGGAMYEGEVREWYLTEDNIQDVLHLMDGGFKEEDINKNLKRLMHIADKERWVRVSKLQKDIVYKGTVTDMFESINTDNLPMEYLAYSIGVRLESGKKYSCTYKIVPHPYKGQQLVMVITNAVPANDSVSTFSVTPENKALLDEFRNLQGTVQERVDLLTQKVKGLLGYNGNDTLIKVIDLSYHTVLAYNFGQFKNVRGYLDTLVVGESRVGKSSTADALRKTYQLGAFTSLAGNSATVPGLIGGSNKSASGQMQTKAGLIPQNHKGLIIFEEFGKCHSSIVTELTDIRSSNEVRITRVSGTLTLPAMVRMIALSNVKYNGNEIKSIASYPNGLAVVTELVPTAEDIARYDILCVLGDRGNAQIDPFWQPETPMSEEAYRARVRWVWSRTPEQIAISEEVAHHIVECANALNYAYDCHIKVFGTEAWKKLTRLAIAVAGYLVSTDDTYQNIVVTKEHVNYAVDLYEELYDNPTFRLREYVLNERRYNQIDNDGVQLLQELYIKIPQMLLILEQESSPSRNTVLAAAGVDANTYNGFMSQLIKGYFVRLNGSDILPTERFRLGMKRINRNASLTRLGEQSNAAVETQ